MSTWRRLLCLVAAVCAGFAGILAAVDKSLWIAPEFISVGLLVMATAALALAAWPGGSEWSTRRRVVAALAALGWILLGAPVLLATITVAGCVCSPGGPGYVPPAPLGIGTRQWIILALLAGPILLFFASAIPTRTAEVVADLS